MKLNNKGITLIEIIISIALISLVLIFLFSLLVTVNDMNDEADVSSTYLINKALILKNIEEDLRTVPNDKTITIKTCNVHDMYGYYPENNSSDYFNGQVNLKANECLEIDDIDDNPAYLAIYYYKNKESYVISYIHRNKKATRTLPDFTTYNIDVRDIKIDLKIKLTNSNKVTCTYPDLNSYCSNDNPGFYKIEIPIIGNDGKDYTILISYYGKVKID